MNNKTDALQLSPNKSTLFIFNTLVIWDLPQLSLGDSLWLYNGLPWLENNEMKANLNPY